MTLHHYTKSKWADGAAMFATGQTKTPLNVGDELIVINKDLNAWEGYAIEEDGMASGGWTFGNIPSDIGISVWLRDKKKA